MSGLGAALPLALGAAISPTVLIANLLVLSSPQKSRVRGLAFAAGGFAVLIAIGGARSDGVAHRGPRIAARTPRCSRGSTSSSPCCSRSSGCARCCVRRRTRPTCGPSGQARQRATYDYFVFGVVMMLTNVTTLMLFIPAMKEVAVADASFARQGRYLCRRTSDHQRGRMGATRARSGRASHRGPRAGRAQPVSVRASANRGHRRRLRVRRVLGRQRVSRTLTPGRGYWLGKRAVGSATVD